MSTDHEWTIDVHLHTFWGYTPWVCKRCWATVDTVDDHIRFMAATGGKCIEYTLALPDRHDKLYGER